MKPPNTRNRISIDLGRLKPHLEKLAKKSDTSPTSLARLLVMDGIDRLASGDIEVNGPFLKTVKAKS